MITIFLKGVKKMKTFRAIASNKTEKNSKKIGNRGEYRSIRFKFKARNFSEALAFAEKYAKKLMIFSALQVKEI